MAVLVDTAIFIAGIMAVKNDSLAAKLIGSLLIAIAIPRLFILGHDACHKSLFRDATINRLIGRLLFCPSLTPYCMWELGHNGVHHGYTNLKGRDFVWTPLSPGEYQALTPARRFRERLYRSIWGTGAYYAIEIWLKKILFPPIEVLRSRAASFVCDITLCVMFTALWLFLLSANDMQSTTVNWLIGFLVPFAVWLWLIGVVIYVHHTHPRVVWYVERKEWRQSLVSASTTVFVRFPVWVDWLLHNIMQHPAHHLHVGIPFYNLRAANEALSQRRDLSFVISTFSPGRHLAITKTCQLYDYQHKQWLPFSKGIEAK